MSARAVALPEDLAARDDGSRLPRLTPPPAPLFFLWSYFGDVYQGLFSCQARLPSGCIVLHCVYLGVGFSSGFQS